MLLDDVASNICLAIPQALWWPPPVGRNRARRVSRSRQGRGTDHDCQVIRCHVTRETRVQGVEDDKASTSIGTVCGG
jgi:hypothetical protein